MDDSSMRITALEKSSSMDMRLEIFKAVLDAAKKT